MHAYYCAFNIHKVSLYLSLCMYASIFLFVLCMDYYICFKWSLSNCFPLWILMLVFQKHEETQKHSLQLQLASYINIISHNVLWFINSFLKMFMWHYSQSRMWPLVSSICIYLINLKASYANNQRGQTVSIETETNTIKKKETRQELAPLGSFFWSQFLE